MYSTYERGDGRLGKQNIVVTGSNKPYFCVQHAKKDTGHQDRGSHFSIPITPVGSSGEILPQVCFGRQTRSIEKVFLYKPGTV